MMMGMFAGIFTKPRVIFAACCTALLLAAGCAAPGAPQPPSLRLPTQVNDLAAERKGSRVVLSWSSPVETTDRQASRWPTVTRICRVLNHYPIDHCEPVYELHSTELASTAPAGHKQQVSFEDVLPPAAIAAQNEATYAVEVLNQRGRSAGLSNQVRVPLPPTAPPPTDFHATLDAQGPLLQWTASWLPAAGTGWSCHYRVYRRAKGKPEFLLAAEEPCGNGQGEVRDPSFEWETEYDYKLVSVAELSQQGKPTVEVEGDDSRVVHLLTRDVFPPLVPTGVQAVFSSVGQKPFIDLTWAPNTERDLAGYHVFRKASDGQFEPANTGLLKAPAWRDENVKPGERYFYTVSAVDLRGNQSAQSSVAEESVP